MSTPLHLGSNHGQLFPAPLPSGHAGAMHQHCRHAIAPVHRVEHVVDGGAFGHIAHPVDRLGTAGRRDGIDRFFHGPGSRSWQTTDAPSAANDMLMARPNPPPAPVTTAIFPPSLVITSEGSAQA